VSEGQGSQIGGGHLEAEDNRPLSERELALVKRLFSDPFAIPLEFKAWLISYLESNPPLMTTSSIFGFRSAVSAQVEALNLADFLPGMMLDWGGDADPDSHWMICDGRTLDRTTYALLYGVLGFKYSPTPGTDPGGNLFHIPDYRDRISIGKGSQVESNALGKRAGSRTNSHTHTMAHTHTIDHYHNVQAWTGGPSGTIWDGYASSPGAAKYANDIGHAHYFNANTGGPSNGGSGAASTATTSGPSDTSIMPPTLTANKIIYVG
jgi:microcystin-dependent protein